MMRNKLLLFHVIALSVLGVFRLTLKWTSSSTISSLSDQVNSGESLSPLGPFLYGASHHDYLVDAPWELSREVVYSENIDENDYNFDDDLKDFTTKKNTNIISGDVSRIVDGSSSLKLTASVGETTFKQSLLIEPSYLKWYASPVQPPQNWSFVTPKYCRNITRFEEEENDNEDDDSREKKIIVHFHMQHNAGTNFWSAIRSYVPCATRCCWQISRHCLVSNNERIEAANIRENYVKHGVQFVSYELMLPPQFSLPFVSKEAREGLFFTTIVRDPFKRLVTYLRTRKVDNSNIYETGSLFWTDLSDRKKDLYAGDNLNVRWLSGAREEITRDHVNIAKCRLQLFDLVISDVLYEYAFKRVLCPLNGWEKDGYCSQKISESGHVSSKKDPLDGINTALIGAWIERLRPSFEVYDYARILSLKQMKERGFKDLPQVSDLPSYRATLFKFSPEIKDSGTKVTLQNEHLFHPPKEFCSQLKSIWGNSNITGDDIPSVYGIGTIKNSFF